MMFLTPDGQLVSVLSLDIAEGQVIGLYSVVNPDKLVHISRTILPSLPPA